MGRCAAVGCSNKDGPGIRLFTFPRDSTRRKQWELKVKRKNWSAKNHRLCQEHFEEDQFERNRADGWKKLKQNAVPTVFSDQPPAKHRKQPANHNSGTSVEHFEEDQFERNRADGWKKLKQNAVPTVFSDQPPAKHRKQPANHNSGTSVDKLVEDHTYCSKKGYRDEPSTSGCSSHDVSAVSPCTSSTTTTSAETCSPSHIPICEEILVANTTPEDFWKHQADQLQCQLSLVKQQLQDHQKQESLTKHIHHIFNEDQYFNNSEVGMSGAMQAGLTT
ncbi:hypothetical protein Pmani_005556 [Petrolisthes manimaculis]|uniref:THAP-type domain-containing protein n=1 Tax=Petrolisthes manimaculis TaxID=1843537 RepID=A0AAE1QCR8_9EUCA|nr:hypothetical protein Pmani_005556 [Petrolisthes manimaculis]